MKINYKIIANIPTIEEESRTIYAATASREDKLAPALKDKLLSLNEWCRDNNHKLASVVINVDYVVEQNDIPEDIRA